MLNSESKTGEKGTGKPMVDIHGSKTSNDLSNAVLAGQINEFNVHFGKDFGQVEDLRPILKADRDKDMLTLIWNVPSFSKNVDDYKVENYKIEILNGQGQVDEARRVDFEKGKHQYESEAFALNLGQNYHIAVSTIYLDIDQEIIYESGSAMLEVSTRPCKPTCTRNNYTEDTLTIEWIAAKGAQNYEIVVFVDGSAEPTFRKDTGKETVYRREFDASFGFGSTYYAVIKAFGANGMSNSDQTLEEIIGGDKVPTNVEVTSDHTKVKDPNAEVFLKWKPPQCSAISYEIVSIPLVESMKVEFNGEECLVSGLKAGTEYFFKVKAVHEENGQHKLSGGCSSKKIRTNSSPLEYDGVSEPGVQRVGWTGRIQIVKQIYNMVFLGVFDNKEVVVKELNRFRLREGIDQELELLRMFDHENIVSYKYHDKDHRSLYIVLEKCNYTLEQFVCSPDLRQKLHPYDILRQLVNGMVYLHEEKRTVHRDLKPSNVLMLFQNGRWIVKISDFGLSKTLPSDESSILVSINGTKCYMAPEQLKGETISRRTDIFSLGLCFHYILSDGKAQVFGEDVYEIPINIRSGSPPKLDSIKNEYECDTAPLVRSMLHHHKKDRPTIKEIQSHHVFWDGYKVLEYIQNVSDYLGIKGNESFLKRLEKSWIQMESDIDWRKRFEDLPAVMEDIDMKERWKEDKPIQKLLKLLKDWSRHFYDFPEELREELCSSKVGLAKFIKSRLPNLLPIVYEAMKEARDKEEFKRFYCS